MNKHATPWSHRIEAGKKRFDSNTGEPLGTVDYHWITNANDELVQLFAVTTPGQLERVHLFLAAPEMLEALEQIVKKVPHDVSREEAADMACEFVLIARDALARAKGGAE